MNKNFLIIAYFLMFSCYITFFTCFCFAEQVNQSKSNSTTKTTTKSTTKTANSKVNKTYNPTEKAVIKTNKATNGNKKVTTIKSKSTKISSNKQTKKSNAAKTTKAVAVTRAKSGNVMIIPNWYGLTDFNFPGLSFDNVTQAQFVKKYPFIKDFEDADSYIRIYTYVPKDKTKFKYIKFGFDDEKLSWIDFVPVKRLELIDLIEYYGTPLEINTKVSEYLDYYNYGNLVISLTKDTGSVYSFTRHGKVDQIVNDAKANRLILPEWQNLAIGKIDKLIPGKTKLSEIKTYYPALKPSDKSAKGFIPSENNNNENNEIDTHVFYEIESGLTNTNYKRVELVFENNILSWIDLVPKKLTLAKALEVFGKSYKLDETNHNVNFYNYKNIILTVSKNAGIVLNIGLLGSVNASLRSVLIPWQQLNKKSIKGIKIDSTTELQFKNTFPDLVARKQSQVNIDIFNVVDGLSMNDYQSIYFVFKNKKLTSVDFVPMGEVKIDEVIKEYGSKYQLDKESDDDLEYYTFDNVIVSVFKNSKVVNSIGLF